MDFFEGLRSQKNLTSQKLINKCAGNKFKKTFYEFITNKHLEFEICSFLVLWSQFFDRWVKKNQVFQNFIEQQKIYYIVYLIKFVLILLFFSPKNGGVVVVFLFCFWGPQELLRLSKKVQIGIVSGLYGKSVLYLFIRELA